MVTMTLRTNLLVLTAVAMLLVVGAGTALARDIACGGGECRGTRLADNMAGSAGVDAMFGLAGSDFLADDAGDDTLEGGRGDDNIDARNARSGSGPAFSGIDVVDCGPGFDDVVADREDRLTNCEDVRFS